MSPESKPLTRRDLLTRTAKLGISSSAIGVILAACRGTEDGSTQTTAAASTTPTVAPVTPNTEIDAADYVKYENTGKVKTLNPNIKEENERVGGVWLSPEEASKQLVSNRLTIAAQSRLAKSEIGPAGIVFTGDGGSLRSSNPERTSAWHIFSWRKEVDPDGRFRGNYSVTVDFADLGVPPESIVTLSFDVLAIARPEVDGENILFVRKAAPHGPHRITTPK